MGREPDERQRDALVLAMVVVIMVMLAIGAVAAWHQAAGVLVLR